MNYGERFKLVLDSSGTTGAALARACGVSPQAVADWKIKGVPAARAYFVATLLNVHPSEISDIKGVAVPEDFVEGKLTAAGLLKDIDPQPLRSGLSRIPQYDTKASLGNGLEFGSEEVLKEWELPTLILDRCGVRTEDAFMVEGVGESMAPTIHHGDLIIIDRTQKTIDGHVFAILTDAGLKIKRLRQAMNGNVTIVSDNESMYPPEEYSPEESQVIFQVLGKAVLIYAAGIK